jgi:uracil-DNA glycosylase
MMHSAAINPDECFFTNAWPCLRVGDVKNTGDPPGSKDKAFTDRCLEFFRLTIRELRPQYVITLGTWPTRFVSGLDPLKMGLWRSAQWSSIDAKDHISLDG